VTRPYTPESALDGEVAEKLFGFRRFACRRPGARLEAEPVWHWFLHPPSEPETPRDWIRPAEPEDEPFADALRDVPYYTTRIEDAFQIVDKALAAGCWMHLKGSNRGWVIDYGSWTKSGYAYAWTSVEPQASLCLAIVKAGLHLHSEGLVSNG